MSDWIEINIEKRRTIYFKSRPEPLALSNVTHYKKRNHGFMLKCHQGVVYCETDDISCIVSECDDWVV